MVILGIDPGSRKTGYAVLNAEKNRSEVLEYGTITLTDLKLMTDKLVRLFEELGELFVKYGIQSVAVEAGFYGKNAQSAYKLGYARSAAVLAAALKRVEVVEYSPRKIKQAVTGNGNASKKQVKYMVRNLLHIDNKERIGEDEADACAAAICHSQNHGRGTRNYKSWKEFVVRNKHLVIHESLGERLA
ncbi:MAG TPA: crossover junction endodeoxyribonuclease RuvC [Candidatus Acidoferrales bacterium]|nr:crossover junction endodeoxyribonuclease RuvC [Candidatus Acidoferrales bacterium]